MLESLPAEASPLACELYHHVQHWKNLQCGKEELWDIYDEKRALTGRKQRRGDYLQIGDYHLVVNVMIMNDKGEFLLTKRAKQGVSQSLGMYGRLCPCGRQQPRRRDS